MANPLQRRKTRSSSHKPVKQSRRANKLLKKQPPIKGPKVLQQTWDKCKTVRQNYDALGLAHSLTPTDLSGRDMMRRGAAHSHRVAESNPKESMSGQVEEQPHSGDETSNALNGQAMNGKLPLGFGRIIRDESGAIVDVMLAEEEMPAGEEAAKDKGSEYFEIGSSSRQPERIPVPPGSGWLLENKDEEEDAENEGAKEMLRALEAASKAGTNRTRTPSPAELKYLFRLVEAYGTDYQAMAKDRKRNVNQYTAGQLRRAMEKAGLGQCQYQC